MTMAQAHVGRNRNFRCPYRTCSYNLFLPISQVERHLFFIEIDANYIYWIFYKEHENRTFLDEDNNKNDQYDESYIDDIDEMLGDIHAVHMLSVNKDMNTHTREPSLIETKKQFLEDARHPLYPGCAMFSKLSFIAKLFHNKIVGSWSANSFDMLIKLLKTVSSKVFLPNSFKKT